MVKSYILPGLTEAQVSKLRSHGIQLFNWKGGYLLVDNDETLLPHALSLLNASHVEEPTNLDGVIQLQLFFAQAGQPKLDPKIAESRRNYIKACSARLDSFVKATREALSKKRTQLPKMEAQYMTLTRQSCFGTDTRNEDALRQDFAHELQRVREVPKVTRVRMTRDQRTLLVYTDTLFAAREESTDRFEIGKFMFRFQMQAQSDAMRFYNATRRVRAISEDMNAPYIYGDGSMMECEIRQTFSELLARCEFAALVDLAIQFIETVNDDEAGKFVNAWPRVV